MGAWGLKTFENDDALDWMLALKETHDLSLVESTLAEWDVGYLEVDDANNILAAVEIVKALQIGIDGDLPDEVKKWASDHQSLDASHLLARAIASVDRVLSDDSELKELWEESDEFSDWENGVKALKSALFP